jgi:8-oxo-dGTP diphosphatase
MLDIGKHYVTLYIGCEWLSGEPRIMEPEKATEISWMSADELLATGDELFPPLREFLQIQSFLRK